MQITNTNGGSVSGLGPSQEVTRSGTAGQARTSESAGGGDQVQLSSLGAHLGASGSVSADHSAKLAQLTAAVSGGSYRVDASAVSASLIQEHSKSGV